MAILSKERELEKLRQKMLKASLPLKKTAKSLVFGAGSYDPKVLFIGEAPGANEDKQGLPFVGAAGKQLDLLLNSINLTRDSVYITSILKYRPPNNRPPTFKEIQAHTPFLADQISILKPKIIVPLGNFATRFILSGLDIEKMSQILGITQIHGKSKQIPFDGMNLTIFPVFHPAAILYKRSLEKALKNDFKKLLTLL